MEHCTYKISITGTVQGVGFRPFVYALAQRYLLCGTVSNNSNGVEIIINVDSFTLRQVLIALEYEHPVLASIDSITHEELPFKTFDSFEIIQTQEHGEVSVNIPPDIHTCSSCEEELFDTSNRRYRYPFICCTQCGVRYSIVNDLPYDRKNTSMQFFKMCEKCEQEYNNPEDKRYHAQPIGCWDCGPQMQLIKSQKDVAIPQREILKEVVKLLEEGNILALKGVGGYHLVCDASNEEVVVKLRERKHRVAKPFAVMVKDIQMAKEMAHISEQEEELLLSKERPIVLLDSIGSTLASSIAPKIKRIGLFLPYTPLHHLLLEALDRPLVATSANITDEPICTHLDDLQKLEGVYDYVLDHNRKIVNGCDDSVVMIVSEQRVTLRRARGYAPMSIKLPFTLKKNVFGLGANQKSTVAIGYDDKVILSPHIGDLDGIASVEYYKHHINTLGRIYKFNANIIAYDKHPRYESTKIAHDILYEEKSLLGVAVQHHYAHILGVMAEKQVRGKVFGVAFDGTGYGDDGMLWGGEFMVCDYQSYERVAHLGYFKLLGGSKAIKEPKRVALSLLFDIYAKKAFALDNPTIHEFSEYELRTYYTAWEKNLNAPLSSSVGRLFDAVASLLGICQVMSFEGESGMLLEEYYDSSVTEHYGVQCKDGQLEVLSIIEELLEEKEIKKAVSKFFNTLVEMIALVYEPYDLPLVLSGGVFQNRILLELVLKRFPKALIPNLIPPNDGGIALGQVVASLNIG